METLASDADRDPGANSSSASSEGNHHSPRASNPLTLSTMQFAVMLIERSALVRSGLRRILEDEPDIAVVAEASNAGDAVAALSHTDVDVVVVSTAADRDAIQTSAIAALRLAANIKIVCVSHWIDSRDVDSVLGAGASGCVEMCDASDADLKTAVCLVGRGERYLSPGYWAVAS